jgi:hypothetical protein
MKEKNLTSRPRMYLIFYNQISDKQYADLFIVPRSFHVEQLKEVQFENACLFRHVECVPVDFRPAYIYSWTPSVGDRWRSLERRYVE